MNFLELVNSTRENCGVPGTIATVAGATNESLLLINWVRQALKEIEQDRPDWEWMRKPFSFNTVVAKQSYSAATDIGLADFGYWRNNSFRIYLTSAGVANEIILDQYEYNLFRDYYLLGSRKLAYARPAAIAVSPDRSLVLGLAPSDIYTVSGEYFRVPQVLSADTDIPDMPERYHMAIVYKAMVKYGNYWAAPEQTQAGASQLSALMNTMAADQTPTVFLGGAMI